MWRRSLSAHLRQPAKHFHTTARLRQASVIEIKNASFYRQYPSDQDVSNPVLFPHLDFALEASQNDQLQFWAVVSPSSLARTTFLQVLGGQHISIPPTARTYPYLSTIGKSPQQAIKYVGFDADRGSNVGGTNVRGAYLSARYESRREETDFSVHNYLVGNTELNALEHDFSESDQKCLDSIVDRLNLRQLLQMPVSNLSNGQTRRVRIAKALMAQPEVLLLDGPFMGLDPNTLRKMELVLYELAMEQSPRLIMSLRPEDGIPDWVNRLVVADDKLRVLAQGPKKEIFSTGDSKEDHGLLNHIIIAAEQGHNTATQTRLSRDAFPQLSPPLDSGEALVEMQGVRVAYGEKVVLGDWNQSTDGNGKQGLWWTLRRGQRCGIFGPNGSGKTTMLSLITSDHPQAYSLPIKLFGRSRLPTSGETGISLFDIQRRMGHSSPEIHAFFPKALTVRQALESAWADAPLSRPNLTEEAKLRINAVLRWFAQEFTGRKDGSLLQVLEATHHDHTGTSEKERLDALRTAYDRTTHNDLDLAWSNDIRFGELSFSNQRLVLFLRAIVAVPDLVILDEAMSGIDEHTRDRTLLFLSHGEELDKVVGDDASASILSQIGQVYFRGLSLEQALLVISHAKEDVPGCLREWICLPEPGEGKLPRTGTLRGPLELNPKGWDDIWGKSI